MDCSNSNEISQGRGGIKVLLVDKDTNLLMTMSRILEERSYRVTTTESTFAAMSMIVEQQSKFDIIICEIDMQGIDGFELLKQMTSTIDIPTILVSTIEDSELMRKALREGACFFFYKPIAPHDLVNIWRYFISHTLAKGQPQKGLTPGELVTYLDRLHGEEKSSVLGEKSFSANSLAMGNSTMLRASALGIDLQLGDSSQLGKRVREDDHKHTCSFSASSSLGYENQNTEKQKGKTPRLCWTPRLQEKFQQVYEALGHLRATPLKIKELMGEPDMTQQHISSYLQKFRVRMKAQEEEAAKQAMLNKLFMSPIYMGIHPSSWYTSRDPSQFYPQVNILPHASNKSGPTLIQTLGNLSQSSRADYYNIQTVERYEQMANLSNFRTYTSNIDINHFGQRSLGLGLQPLEPILAKSHNNIGGLKPQMVKELINFLGTVGDNIGASEGNEVPQNGGLGMKGESLDMAQEMSVKEVESIIDQFPDDDSSKDASSPEGNDSECSVNRPSPPRIGTATTGDRDAETSSDKSVEDDMNRFLDDM